MNRGDHPCWSHKGLQRSNEITDAMYITNLKNINIPSLDSCIYINIQISKTGTLMAFRIAEGLPWFHRHFSASTVPAAWNVLPYQTISCVSAGAPPYPAGKSCQHDAWPDCTVPTVPWDTRYREGMLHAFPSSPLCYSTLHTASVQGMDKNLIFTIIYLRRHQSM